MGNTYRRIRLRVGLRFKSLWRSSFRCCPLVCQHGEEILPLLLVLVTGWEGAVILTVAFVLLSVVSVVPAAVSIGAIKLSWVYLMGKILEIVMLCFRSSPAQVCLSFSFLSFFLRSPFSCRLLNQGISNKEISDIDMSWLASNRCPTITLQFCCTFMILIEMFLSCKSYSAKFTWPIPSTVCNY